MFLRLVLLHAPFWINISEVGVTTLKSLHTSKFDLGVHNFARPPQRSLDNYLCVRIFG